MNILETQLVKHIVCDSVYPFEKIIIHWGLIIDFPKNKESTSKTLRVGPLHCSGSDLHSPTMADNSKNQQDRGKEEQEQYGVLLYHK
jgi:hypothetical protein